MKPLSTDLETLHAGRHLSLVRRGHWEFATRHGATGVVGLVAVTDDAKMVLVEQTRPPLGKRVIELPAGLSGDIAGEESESLITAAKRELLEETGYEAQEVRMLTEGPSSAGLTKTGAGGGDASEDIVVHEIPLAGLPEWLEERRRAGWAIDPKIFVGLFWIKHNSLPLGDKGDE